MKATVCISVLTILVSCGTGRDIFTYDGNGLLMTSGFVKDHAGEFSADTLRVVEPECDRKLTEKVTVLTEKMYNIALYDCEQNIVTNNYGTYFAAGRRYTDRVYTRDIAIAGILGLNYYYPELVLNSLKISREVRKELGWKTSPDGVIKEIDAPWEVAAASEPDIMSQYSTNSYTRRTDDVIWIWSVYNIYQIRPDLADWEWLYTTAKYYFENFYFPLYDSKDGLFRGQPVYHDITNSAYPRGYTKSDCVLLKASSTNSVYYKALRVMSEAASRLGLETESDEWADMADKLKRGFINNLLDGSGKVLYYIDRNGVPSDRQEILGVSFSVICGVLEDEAARNAVIDYPFDGAGIQLIYPFLDNNGPHNKASWPFCSTFYCWAREKATGESMLSYNAALLARSLGTKLSPKDSKEWGGFGSFHEKVLLPKGIVCGSGAQLWSAASFLNVCIRAGIVEGFDRLVE